MTVFSNVFPLFHRTDAMLEVRSVFGTNGLYLILALVTVVKNPTTTAASTTEEESSSWLTPAQMQKKMGLGINLGNRVDLYDQPPRTGKPNIPHIWLFSLNLTPL